MWEELALALKPLLEMSKQRGNGEEIKDPFFLERNSDDFWDPIGKCPNEKDLFENNKDIEAKYAFYKQNPYQISKNLKKVIIGLIVLLLLSLFVSFFFFLFFTLLLIFRSFYLKFIKGLQVDLVKKIIAEKNNWKYNPRKDYYQAKNLRENFSILFKKKGENDFENLDDEFWGDLETSRKEVVPFYSALFHREIQKKSRKKTSTGADIYNTIDTEDLTFFALKLKETIKYPIILLPQKKSSNIFSFGKKDKITMEYENFNNIFSIFFDGKKNMEKQIEIVRKISPAVQELLVNLAEKFPSLKIMFSGNSFIFLREGGLFEKKMKTNFKKEVFLHPDDEKDLEKTMKDILLIAKEVPKYLD